MAFNPDNRWEFLFGVGGGGRDIYPRISITTLEITRHHTIWTACMKKGPIFQGRFTVLRVGLIYNYPMTNNMVVPCFRRSPLPRSTGSTFPPPPGPLLVLLFDCHDREST